MSSKHTQSQCFTAVRIFVMIALLASTLAGAHETSAAAQASLAGWLNNTIESPVDTTYAPSLAVDSTGKPHVAYLSGMNLNLVYRSWDGAAWQNQWAPGGRAQFINLALDDSDIPHITFQRTEGGGSALFHATPGGQGWITEQITTQTNAGDFNSLALDDAGRPHVAYVNRDDNSIVYSYYDGSTWQHATAAAAVFRRFYSHVSLALDSLGLPHIAYCGGSTFETCNLLFYSRFDGTAWAEETLLSGAGGYSVSLALDSADRPHLSYFRVNNDGSNPSLEYRFNNGGWQSQTVASGAQGINNVLRLDSMGHPQIVFHDQTDLDLEYAVSNGTSWTVSTVQDTGSTGLFPSFALDAADQPHIAYLSVDELALQYSGKPPLPDLVVPELWVGEDGWLNASVRNAGLAPANGLIQLNLLIDGVDPDPISKSGTLEPYGSMVLSGPYVCSGSTDEISACALIDGITETDPTNNCRVETIQCDTLPPAIVSGPTVSSIGTTSAVISWQTDEPSTSYVKYGWQAGISTVVNVVNLVTQHTVTLTELRSGVPYSYTVRSVDNGGKRVESRTAYFRTLPSAGNPPVPAEFQAQLKDPVTEIYGLNVSFADTSNIGKVTFLVDGKVVGSDFSSVNGFFEVDLNPAELWPDRNQFYRGDDPHQVQVQVTSASGVVTNYPYQFTPSPAMRVVRGYFITPEEGKILYIPGDSAPSRTIGVNVYASQLEWACEWIPGSGQSCDHLEKDVASVELLLGEQSLGIETTTTRTHTYHFDWDIEGLTPGSHELTARITDTDDNQKTVTRQVTIATGVPVLTLDRLVARDGNHFNVTLTVKNESPAGLPVQIDSVYDTMAGFQPVNNRSGAYQRTALTFTDGIYMRADIAVNQTLQPGQTLLVDYEMVPILYQDPESVTPRIGTTPVIGGSPAWIEYTLQEASRMAEFDLETMEVQDPAAPGGWSGIPAAIGRAMAQSDYLIITSPQKMYQIGWGMGDISTLMGDAAHLAALKNGVLAYWPPNGSRSALNNLLEDDSNWTNRLHPNFEVRSKGYVLLVGESDIIPSFTTGPFSINFPGSDPEMYVHYSDNPYAHTDGNGAPDLLVGRIVGGNPVFLDKAIRTSIRKYLGELTNDMSNAYLGSGTGNREETMQSDADTVEQDFIDRGIVPTKQHWETSGWLRQWDIPFMEKDGFTAGDLDGDGNDEILLGSREQDAILIINGENGALLSVIPLGDFERGDGLAAGDVNSDGKDEVIFADRADQVTIFSLVGNQWSVIAQFALDFDSGDALATGRVLLGRTDDLIIKADWGSDEISIIDMNGIAQVPDIDLDALGYEFEYFDGLATGDVVTAALHEILVTDRTNQKIIVLGANGTVYQEMSVSINYGDQLAVGDVTIDTGDEILLSDWRDAVHIYRGRATDPAQSFTYLRSIEKDVEVWDGLTIRQVTGAHNDEVIYADRSHDRMIVLDPYFPEANRHAFRQVAPGQDLVWLMAHGSPSSIAPTFDSGTFPVNFGSSAPVVTAFSCSTGDYEGGGDANMAVQFFNSGAGGYFGSTEVSPVDQNSNMARKLFRDFWEDGEPLVEAILELKNQRWNVSEFYDWWWLVVNEYNYYGDPKFEATDLSSQFVAPNISSPDLLQMADTTLTLDLPDVTITSQDGLDVVSIAGGDEYLEKDQPIVPTFVVTRSIPAGESVQEVSLVARSDSSEFSDLLLPLATMDLLARSGEYQKRDAADPIPTWTPSIEQPFTWTLNSEPGGDSTLLITVYPFRYNYEARYAEYFRHFEFEVRTISADTRIQAASLVGEPFGLGQDLTLRVNMEKTGEPADRILSAALYDLGGEVPVRGFPLQFLPNLTGEGHSEFTLSSAGLAAGSYYVRVEVLDALGQVHDWREVYFDLGIHSAAITGLDPVQASFRPGESVMFTGQSTNTGDLPLEAQLVLAVSSLDGSYYTSETQDLTSIAPNAGIPFTFTWDSSGVEKGLYQFAAYLVYQSQTSPVVLAEIEIRPDQTIYLPIIR